jgi:basic membrane protein A
MVMITDTGGLGDGGFNDSIWSGMEKASTDFGYKIDCIESTQAADYGPNIAKAAEAGYDIVICVGYLFIDVLGEVAPEYPDTHFVMIDGAVEGDNVYSYTFDLQQSSYLAGALAALALDGSYGFVGGMEVPSVLAWESGYISGIKTIKPDAEILTAYVGSFADPDKAKELALAQFDKGAKEVMEVSSGGAIGVIQAAQESGNLFIATDSSKDALAPGCEFTAALAKRDMAVYAVAKSIAEGTAVAGKTQVMGIKDGVFGLPDDTESRYGSDAVATIEKLKEMIISGDIVVPATRDEVAAFQYPTLD